MANASRTVAADTLIHAGDTVFINVWNHPELSKQVVVDANGNVRVPLSGVVEIGGLDEVAAAKNVVAALRQYVRYPAVNIETVAQGTSVFVSGGPVGNLKYTPGETLEAAIADELQPTNAATTTQALNDFGQTTNKSIDAAAAVRSRIDLHAVMVQRDAQLLGVYDTIALEQHGEPGPLLEPGDTIVFRYKPVVVRVNGDVSQPGLTYLAEDQSLSEAITQAGGLLPTSASNHVLLTRDGETRSLALGDAAFVAPAHNGDIVAVPEAPRVSVVGMVVTPGVVSLRNDPTLLSAVYSAGGPAHMANLKDVQIVHGNTKSSYNITALTHGDLSQNPVLADGDTVLVPRSNGIDFDPFINILGGIAAGLTNHLPL